MARKKRSPGRIGPAPPVPRAEWPRPPWFPRHWTYDPQLLPSRKQFLVQLHEHERILTTPTHKQKGITE